MIKDYKTEDAIILFSGGQDSTTCLYWAIEKFRKVSALSFTYGQKHSLEVELAKDIAEKAGVDFTLINIDFMSTLAPNSLTNSEIVMDECKPEGSYPNTFVPARNMLFLAIASASAFFKKAKNIVIGASEADFSGYPDCREEFIKSMNQTINLALDTDITIHSPLMYLDKSQVWELSDRLGVFDIVRDNTLTCYNGIKGAGCGNCPACVLRNKGLNEFLYRKNAKR